MPQVRRPRCAGRLLRGPCCSRPPKGSIHNQRLVLRWADADCAAWWLSHRAWAPSHFSDRAALDGHEACEALVDTERDNRYCLTRTYPRAIITAESRSTVPPDQGEPEPHAEATGARVGGIRIEVDLSNLPDVTYTNQLIAHFTGGEIVLYGTVIEFPLPKRSGEPFPSPLRARVQGRWIMAPDKFLDHILRSNELIRRTPILREIYEELEAGLSNEGSG